jgi:hypothetical protein
MECKSYLPIHLKLVSGTKFLQFVETEDKSTHFCREYKTLYKIGFGVYVWDYYIIFGVPDNYITFESGVIPLSMADYYKKLQCKNHNYITVNDEGFNSDDDVFNYLSEQSFEQGLYIINFAANEKILYAEVI